MRGGVNGEDLRESFVLTLLRPGEEPLRGEDEVIEVLLGELCGVLRGEFCWVFSDLAGDC